MALADQHAQHVGDEGGLGFAFDLQRALKLEEHPSAALRLGCGEERAHAHTCARLDRRNEPDLVQSVIERTRGIRRNRKSTRLNSSHVAISYAVFCLKKKKKNTQNTIDKKKNKTQK